MKRMVPPTNQEAARGKQQATADNITKTIEKGDLKQFNETATELLEDHDSVSVVSAALKLLTKERKDVPVRISSIQPISIKSAKGGRDSKRRRGGGKRFYGKRRSQGRGGRRQSNYQKRHNR